MDRREREDLEREIAADLSARLRRLRRLVLFPMLLLCASVAPPAYFVLRELQLEAQWADGAERAYHVPVVTGALSLVPVAIAFGVVLVVYQRMQSSRLRRWKAELAERDGLPESELELGQIFH